MLDAQTSADEGPTASEATVANLIADAIRVAEQPSARKSESRQELLESLSRDVGQQIRAAEAKLDRAGIAVAEVMINYLRSERAARLSPSLGQAAVGEMIHALGSWYEFRTRTVSGHEKLFELAGRLGTQEVAGGDIFRDP